MISILLPCYKSKKLLKHVGIGTFREPFEIIYYDNGGNGDYLERVRKEKNPYHIVLGDGENIGLNKALNACAEQATCPYFFLPHTDMYLMSGWDSALLKAAKPHAPGTFLFCSRSIEPQKGHTNFHIIKDYGREAEEFQHDKLYSDFKEHHDTSIVTGYRMPFFMHRKLWEKMGGVDGNLFSYATDDDLFLSAYDVGVRKFWMVNGSLVYHLQGKSNAQQTVDKDSDKPYEYLRNKWRKKGYNMDQPLDQMMQSLVPWNLKVA